MALELGALLLYCCFQIDPLVACFRATFVTPESWGLCPLCEAGNPPVKVVDLFLSDLCKNVYGLGFLVLGVFLLGILSTSLVEDLGAKVV